MNKLFGYARVSTDEQDLSAQTRALEMEGVHKSDIFIEKISSRVKQRAELENVITSMEDGDTLVVYKLD